ncbi:hypothetical protein HMPREF0971_02923 [Segatella oris F0302]|uniref:Uncharacterized protein n=1 Tax=Segatella oris F0302 TaxID=649760 RepID=D1QVE5_9BACT|nr:hypothetical protein HMPREF0971_02923 [Segatella oris F0302]
MSKKLKKMAFRGLGRTKNWEKGFPTPRMSRKLEKMTFQPLG